jgi:ABC-2 type transport system permease protein
MPPLSFTGRIRQLFSREIRIITKDHSLLLTLLIAPVLYAFFYGSIYTNKEEEEVRLALVDDDRSSVSRLLSRQIDNAQAVKVVPVLSLQEAEQEMFRGNVQGYLYLEKGMEQNIYTLHQAHVVLAVNAARFLPSSDLLGSITQTCLTVGAGVRLKYLQKSEGESSAISMQEVMPVKLDYRPLYNERTSYGAFLLPGLLALILQQTLLIGLSESVSGERRNGSVPDWMGQAGNNMLIALWGKGLFYLLLFGAYAFFFLNVNFTLLKLPVRGSHIDLSVLLFLFIITLIPMAQWIGSLFRSQLLNMQFMAFSTYPIFLITGYSWPFESLPLPLQWLSNLLPTTPFIKVYQSIVQAGGSLSDNRPAVGHLFLLFLFYTLIALLRLWIIRKKAGAEIAPAG